LYDIVRLVKAGELALVFENLVTGVFDIWTAFQLSYVMDCYVGTFFELEIVNTLFIRIEAFAGRQEAPVRLFGFVKRQPLQIIEASFHGRHLELLCEVCSTFVF
jgi:hypothetical protein